MFSPKQNSSPLDQTFRNDWMSGAASLLPTNAAIVATDGWEINQQDYNQVWLEMMAYDQEAPDSLQSLTLWSIADQCPYAGGEAVHQARALLGDGYAFDDMNLCAPAPPLSKPEPETFGFDVYPNPGQHYAVMILEEEAADDGLVTITDLMGREILVQPFEKDVQEVYLIFDSLPAGIYLLTVRLGGNSKTRLFSIVN